MAAVRDQVALVRDENGRAEDDAECGEEKEAHLEVVPLVTLQHGEHEDDQ